ncbi:MAG: hypothetical protein H0V15_00800, partial [Solirubrobacterales bacterium]|nr:hypothetical protein [Solirubrobacterales bacterium]
MFNALARLADARGKWVVAVAIVFFLAAGAIGGSVADKLDPYGADDPDTETVRAQERLDDAGFRDASAIVLIEGVDATTPAGAKRVAEVASLVGADADVEKVVGFAETKSPDFVSEQG